MFSAEMLSCSHELLTPPDLLPSRNQLPSLPLGEPPRDGFVDAPAGNQVVLRCNGFPQSETRHELSLGLALRVRLRAAAAVAIVLQRFR